MDFLHSVLCFLAFDIPDLFLVPLEAARQTQTILSFVQTSCPELKFRSRLERGGLILSSNKSPHFRIQLPLKNIMSTNTDINNEPTSDSVQRTRNNEQATYNYKERLSLQTQETKDSKTKKAGLGKLPPPAAVDAKSVQARTEAVIKREELHGKRELVAPTMSLGNKGRSAGFYCEACDLTFKDSNSYLDHLNSSGRIILF